MLLIWLRCEHRVIYSDVSRNRVKKKHVCSSITAPANKNGKELLIRLYSPRQIRFSNEERSTISEEKR